MIDHAFTVEFYETSVRARIDAVSISEGEGAHDIIKIQGVLFGSFDRLPTGTPLKVWWRSTRSRQRATFGYVSHIRPAPGDSMEFTLYGVGATFYMKNAHHRAWDQPTLTQVVKDVAQEHRFDIEVDELPRKLSMEVQTGTTDWDFLRELAKEHGRMLIPWGTTLRMTDPEVVARQSATAAGLRLIPVVHATDFDPDIGSTSVRGGERATRYGFGVDPNTKRIVGGKSEQRPPLAHLGRKRLEPVFDRMVSSPADSVQEVLDGVAAADRQNAWATIGKGIAGGDPAIRPGKIVYLTARERRAIQQEMGPWFVVETEHMMSHGHYRTKFTLGRDGYGVEIPHIPPRSGELSNDGYAGNLIPPARLLAGKWVASWAR